MKRNVLAVLVFLAFGFAASAQTTQGSWLVGGNIGLNTAKENTSITLAPNAGYFFINNFAVGAKVNLNYAKVGENKTTDLGIGPFARYYFGTLNIRPFLNGEVNFLSSKTKVPNATGGSTTNTENGTEYYLAGGLAAFINRNVAIEGLAGYDHTALKGQNGSGGFALKIGFQVYLSRAQVASLKGNL